MYFLFQPWTIDHRLWTFFTTFKIRDGSCKTKLHKYRSPTMKKLFFLLFMGFHIGAIAQQNTTRMNVSTNGVKAKNVLGGELESCCFEPMTGYFRDGYCRTDMMDRGVHTVCAIMTQEFLDYTKSKGNDLSTPWPQFRFPGLKPGDKWCLCASRWLEAHHAGFAPKVDLKATHEKTLSIVDLEILRLYVVEEK